MSVSGSTPMIEFAAGALTLVRFPNWSMIPFSNRDRETPCTRAVPSMREKVESGYEARPITPNIFCR